MPYIALTNAEAQSFSQPGYSRSTKCYRDEYREKYIPGTKERPGYVRNWTEKVEISCARRSVDPSSPRLQSAEFDSNDCSQGNDWWSARGWTWCCSIKETRSLDWSPCWGRSRSNGRLPNRWWLISWGYLPSNRFRDLTRPVHYGGPEVEGLALNYQKHLGAEPAKTPAGLCSAVPPRTLSEPLAASSFRSDQPLPFDPEHTGSCCALYVRCHQRNHYPRSV